jgi:hypothetical protein
MGRRKVSLDSLMESYSGLDYNEIYKAVVGRIEAGELKPVKSAGVNGMKPALPVSYWVETEEADYSEILDELKFKLNPMLNIEYYKKFPQKYEQDRIYILRLSDYLSNRSKLLETKESMNERSFEIFGREKFFQQEGGLSLCARLGVSRQMLNFYDTAEPLAYYSANRETPQNMLIIENMDTFYDLRSHMRNGNLSICGTKFSTIIYGAGKSAYKSLAYYAECAEEHLKCEKNSFYYFGDLDYEGILIYEHIIANGEKNGQERLPLFAKAYEKMIEKAQIMGFDRLPLTKEKQNTNIGVVFLNQFSEDIKTKILDILHSGRYIPQEILNEHDW